MSSLPDPKTIPHRIEVASVELEQWLASLFTTREEIHQNMGLGYLGLPILINPDLPPHTILSKNRYGEPLRLFIKRENDLLTMDLSIPVEERLKNLYMLPKPKMGIL